MGVIVVNTSESPSAQRLMKAFSQFRKTHWNPRHVHNLKPSEFRVLYTIANTDDCNNSGLMVSQISNSLGIASPTVTQLVNGLKAKGFLKKRPDPVDKRVVRINLSEKGKDLVKKASEEFYARFNGLAEFLGEKKSDELANLLLDVSSYFARKNSRHDIERIKHD